MRIVAHAHSCIHACRPAHDCTSSVAYSSTSSVKACARRGLGARAPPRGAAFSLPRIQCGVFALGGASARRPILQAEARTSPAAAGGINLRVAPSAMSTPEQQRNAAQAPSWQRLWTPDHAAELQAAVDQIFENNAGSLKDMRFSVTVADPSVKDAPLVGCSEGFSELCGYRMDEIVGRNCRFLVDPVPKDSLRIARRRL